MLLKILRHGTGSGRKAADYLLSECDHSGSRRASVETLRGDPLLLGHLIDSLRFEHRYTSVVIAWHHKDKPSTRQIDEVLSLFEHVARSGLRRDRFGYCAVLHGDAVGGVHIHILAARVDLTTGKSFNIAPPGWQATFDRFRDYFNFRYGWADPDEILPPRSINGIPPRGDFTKFKADIDRWLLSKIEAGTIKNREDLISALEANGEVTWEGARYVKFRPSGSKKVLCLKGPLFARAVEFSAIAEAVESGFSDCDGSRCIDLRRSRLALKKLRLEMLKRAAYNRKRYGDPHNELNQMDVELPEPQPISALSQYADSPVLERARPQTVEAPAFESQNRGNGDFSGSTWKPDIEMPVDVLRDCPVESTTAEDQQKYLTEFDEPGFG